MQYQHEPANPKSPNSGTLPDRSCIQPIVDQYTPSRTTDGLGALIPPSSASAAHVMPFPANPIIKELPASHRAIVERVFASRDYAELDKAMTELVRLGGLDSAKALVCLLSEATIADGALARTSTGGRHVVVYALCRALLKTAEASRLSEYKDIHPEQHLTKKEVRDVRRLIHALAKGDHGDVETAVGARGLLFERVGSVPGIGAILEMTLKAAAWITRTPDGAPPKVLFILYDLPWAFRSRLPFASTDSRKNNLLGILSQKREASSMTPCISPQRQGKLLNG